MKTIKIIPNYYNEFRCTQINCPNTCCKGWLIDIDPKTYSKYCKLTDEFSFQVLNKISAQTKQIHMNKYYCPFLDDDMLCKIQKKYGADYVCKTCRVFPRTQKTFANIIRHDLALSCPQSIKIISSKKQLLYNFEYGDAPQVNSSQDNKYYIPTEDNNIEVNFYFKFNKIILKIINNNRNESKRLFIYLNFINDFAKQFKILNSDFSKTEIFDYFNQEYFNSLSKSYKCTKSVQTLYSMFFNIEQNFKDTAIINDTLACFFDHNIFSLNDLQSKQALKDFNKQYKKYFKSINKTINFDNILNYYINLSSFNCIKNLDFEAESFFAFYMIYLYKFVLIKAFALEKKLTEDKMLAYLSSTSRATEHTDCKYTIRNKFIKLKEFNLDSINKFLKSKL